MDRYVPDPTIVRPAHNLPYIVAVVLMMALGVVAVTMIAVLRPGADNTLVNTTIISFLAPTTLSLLAFMKAQETHLSVNSRLDAFMSHAKEAAHARGVTQGRAESRDERLSDAVAEDARRPPPEA